MYYFKLLSRFSLSLRHNYKFIAGGLHLLRGSSRYQDRFQVVKTRRKRNIQPNIELRGRTCRFTKSKCIKMSHAPRYQKSRIWCFIWIKSFLIFYAKQKCSASVVLTTRSQRRRKAPIHLCFICNALQTIWLLCTSSFPCMKLLHSFPPSCRHRMHIDCSAWIVRHLFQQGRVPCNAREKMRCKAADNGLWTFCCFVKENKCSKWWVTSMQMDCVACVVRHLFQQGRVPCDAREEMRCKLLLTSHGHWTFGWLGKEMMKMTIDIICCSMFQVSTPGISLSNWCLQHKPSFTFITTDCLEH